MHSELDRLDIVTAAIRQGCSTKAVRRRIENGTLQAVKERVCDDNGRIVFKTMIKIADLEAAFAPVHVGPTSHERLVQEVSAAAPRFTGAQKARIAAALRQAS